MSSKNTKKRKKEDASLNLITKFPYFTLGNLSHIFILLLLTLSGELSRSLEVDYATLLQIISIITLVFLTIIYAMRWTYPLYNEVPLLVILVWIILSTQISLYCICCHESTPAIHHHGFSLKSIAPGERKEEWEAEEFLLSDGEEEEAEEGEDDWHGRKYVKMKVVVTEEEEGEEWKCSQENFSYVYSLMGIALFLVSSMIDIRNYYLSLLNRAITLFMVILLLVLMILSPASCSQFNLLEGNSFILILRITLYNILWFVAHYKSETESVLFSHYKEALRKSHRSPLSSLPRQERIRVSDLADIPTTILRELERVLVSLRKIGPSLEERERDREEGEVVTRGQVFNKDLIKLIEVNHFFSDNAWFIGVLSWKNRYCGRETQRVFDIIQTLWVLIVPPLWLIVFSLLSLVWYLYQIHTNCHELRHTIKPVRRLDLLSPQF